jgi:TrmH family RNA methyltransferase
VLLDGEHLLQDAVNAGLAVQVVVHDGQRRDAVEAARRHGADVLEASPAVLDAVSPVRTPTGVVAAVVWSPRGVADAIAGAGLVLGLVDVQDPGNVGAAIRAADAFGAHAVLALGETADPGHWRALRGAMGSTFRLPVARAGTGEGLDAARRAGLQIVATVADGGTPLATLDLARPSLVLLGREGSGLPDALVAGADTAVTIPMRQGVESLNVAVAAAVIAYEAGRRRSRA